MTRFEEDVDTILRTVNEMALAEIQKGTITASDVQAYTIDTLADKLSMTRRKLNQVQRYINMIMEG